MKNTPLYEREPLLADAIQAGTDSVRGQRVLLVDDLWDKLWFRAYGNQLMEVDVTLGETVSVSEPRVVFKGDPISVDLTLGYAVVGNGERFIAARHVPDPDGSTPSITVVQNWFAEFAARRPTAPQGGGCGLSAAVVARALPPSQPDVYRAPDRSRRARRPLGSNRRCVGPPTSLHFVRLAAVGVRFAAMSSPPASLDRLGRRSQRRRRIGDVAVQAFID